MDAEVHVKYYIIILQVYTVYDKYSTICIPILHYNACRSTCKVLHYILQVTVMDNTVNVTLNNSKFSWTSARRNVGLSFN